MARSMRSSVSIPPELRVRMDATSQSVNWSTVACEAFERKLTEIEGGDAMQAEVTARVIHVLQGAIAALKDGK
jgi:predicted DNA-binding protein